MAIENASGGFSGIKQPSLLDGLRPAQPSSATKDGPVSKEGSEFKRALEGAIGTVTGTSQAGKALSAAASALKFSNHAIERMRSRGINFQPEEMNKISSAIGRAAAKGAKDTLILSGENALIVSVKNNTVVTVMDRAAMKENVFTNIDSTVVI